MIPSVSHNRSSPLWAPVAIVATALLAWLRTQTHARRQTCILLSALSWYRKEPS
jgi:hypothetical protein